jgi:hypothetical protein
MTGIEFEVASETMISRTPTLGEWPYRMERLACDYCPRRGAALLSH